MKEASTIPDPRAGAAAGVRFRSETSIEQVQVIRRLSSYTLDDIVAMWGDESEQKERQRQISRQQQQRYEEKVDRQSKGQTGKPEENSRLPDEDR